MRRFRFVFLICVAALLVPLALLVERALHSVAIERQMRHQTLAERVFDEMERGLSRLLEREEERPVEQYAGSIDTAEFPFVVGHFHVDRDGVVRSVPAATQLGGAGPRTVPDANEELEQTVGRYWQSGKTTNARHAAQAQLPGTTLELGQDDRPASAAKPEAAGERLAGSKEVSAFDALRSLNKGVLERADRQRKTAASDRRDEARANRESDYDSLAAAPTLEGQLLDTFRSASELSPMTGRVVDARHMLLYRTVMSAAQVQRQGLLLDVTRLTSWLRDQGLGNDGLSTHAQVSFSTPFDSQSLASSAGPAFVYQHRFAEPFDGLTARLLLRPLPGVGSTTYVYALCALVLASALLGLAALYRMVSVVVSFAERRSNFVAAVSHELKTPLTAIRMYGEMLRDGMVLSETKRDEYYRHITAESERLSRLINNVLEFARLEKGTRDVNLVVGPVAPVVNELAELVRPHLESHGFTLRVTLDPDLPPLRYERDALMQVLWNLIDNAVKYAGDGPKQIELRGRRDGSNVVLSVRDHGTGVAAQHLGKIFDPFYRGESELTRRSKGTGLGLALVRGLVERMGARVSGRNMSDGGFEIQVAFRAA